MVTVLPEIVTASLPAAEESTVALSPSRVTGTTSASSHS